MTAPAPLSPKQQLREQARKARVAQPTRTP